MLLDKQGNPLPPLPPAIKKKNLTFQMFLIVFAELMRRMRYQYYHRSASTKWLNPTIVRSGIKFDPILLSLRLNNTPHRPKSYFTAWNIFRWEIKSALEKRVITEQTLGLIVKCFPGRLEWENMQAMGANPSAEIVKKITLETGDIDFYTQSMSRYYNNTTSTITSLTDVNTVLDKLVESGQKVTGFSAGGLKRMIEGIKSEIQTSKNLDSYVKLYNKLKTVKGYTTSTRALLIVYLIKYSSDPDKINKLKILLKKEKSKRVWTDFKEHVLNDIFEVSYQYSYKASGYIGSFKKGKKGELEKFLKEVESTPQLQYYWKQTKLKKTKEMLEKDQLKEKE